MSRATWPGTPFRKPSSFRWWGGTRRRWEIRESASGTTYWCADCNRATLGWPPRHWPDCPRQGDPAEDRDAEEER